MREWLKVELEVGQELKPGQVWRGYHQYDAHWVRYNRYGWSDERGQGFFMRPPDPVTKHTYIGSPECAEMLAYEEADNRANHMTPEQMQEYLERNSMRLKEDWYKQKELKERKDDEARVNGRVYDPSRYRR